MKAAETGFARPKGQRRADVRYGMPCLASVVVVLLMGIGALTVPRACAQEPAVLLLLSPDDERDDLYLPGDFLIAISIIDPDAQIDLPSIRLFVDERDVTGDATLTSAVVTYIPDPTLGPGPHRFDLRLKDVEGNDLPGLSREIDVAGRIDEEPDWEMRGRVTLESNTDDLSGPGAQLRQEPDQTNTARVRMDGRLGGWNYDGTMFLTSDEKEGYQPRNRYRFHVNRGWVGVDVGDVNYSFSPMVLSGKRTRGLGVYLRLGDMEISALRGSIRRGIEGEIQTDAATGDTLDITGATYERDLVGARVAFGTGRTLQLAFDGVRVRDKVESISAGLLPKDNVVFGSSVILAPFKRRLILDASAAFSFVTEDITGGALSKEEIEDLIEDANVPFNPEDYEDIFIMNLSTRPLDPMDLSSFAIRGSLRGNLLGHIFEGRYQQVGPSFVSLAAPSVQNDKRGYRLTDTFRLIGNRLRISGELEGFEDNLKDDKDFTTDTQITGLTTSFLPKWAGLRHVTVGLRLYGRENDASAPAVADSADYRVDDRTTTLRVGSAYHFRWYARHEFSVSYLDSETDALNPFADATQSDWILGWITRLQNVPLVLEVGLGENDTEYPAAGTQVNYSTRRFRGSYDLLNGRLQTHASYTQVAGESNQGIVGGDKRTMDAGARYQVARKTYVSGRLASVDFADDVDPDNDYKETVFNIRVTQDF